MTLLFLKDRNVVKTVRWVWEDSSLSVFIILGRGRFWEVSFLVVIWVQRTPIFALSLKDRNVVKTVRWVWEDSSLSCIYYLGSGTILGSFISGCNMKATNTRICFNVSTRSGQICPGRRSNCKSTISWASWQGCHKIWNFRPNLVAIWSTSEKFAKLSYIIGYLDCFWAN